jgi:hypothetical protein
MLVGRNNKHGRRIRAAKKPTSARSTRLFWARNFCHFPIELVADDDFGQKLLTIVAFNVFVVGSVVVVVFATFLSVCVVVTPFDMTFLR